MNKVGINFENVLTIKEELNLNLLQTLSKLKSLGITSLDVKYERLIGENSYLKEILISGFNVGSVFAFCPLYEQNNLQKALKIVDFCAEYKIKEIMLISDFLQNGYNKDEIFNLKQNLRRIVKYAQNFGVMVAVENVNQETYPIKTVENCIDFIKSVKGLQIVFDGGNFLTAKQDVLYASSVLAPFVQRLHLKNAKESDGAFDFIALGEGGIDYIKVFNAIKNCYAHVPVVIEFPFEQKNIYKLVEKSALYLHTEMI